MKILPEEGCLCTEVLDFNVDHFFQVTDQCKDHIFIIETLKDFQYVEENKDQGMNVREKAKALATLLKVGIYLTYDKYYQ